MTSALTRNGSRSDVQARRRVLVGAIGAVSLAAGAWLGGGDTTLAAYSDRVVTHHEVGAGTWLEPPPAACGPVNRYSAVVRGTPGRDVLVNLTGRPQILMGSEGRDLLKAGHAGDCLVGGNGDDILTGHLGDDVLLGGLGDDVLAGGLGHDLLDGGSGIDTCSSGLRPRSIVACERGATSVLAARPDPAEVAEPEVGSSIPPTVSQEVEAESPEERSEERSVQPREETSAETVEANEASEADEATD